MKKKKIIIISSLLVIFLVGVSILCVHSFKDRSSNDATIETKEESIKDETKTEDNSIEEEKKEPEEKQEEQVDSTKSEDNQTNNTKSSNNTSSSKSNSSVDNTTTYQQPSSDSSSTSSNNEVKETTTPSNNETKSYVGVPDPNNFNYSMHKGVIEYSTLQDCLNASNEIGFKDTVDILNTNCLDVRDSNNTVLGYYLYINCSSGNCNKYKN